MFCWSSLRSPGNGSPSAQTSAAGANCCSKTLAVESVVHHRVAVEELAGVGVDEHHVADVAAVGDLDDVGQDVRRRHAPGRAGAVDHEVGAGRADAGRVALRTVVGRAGRPAPRAPRAPRPRRPRARGDRDVQVGGGVAVDRGQVTLLVEVGEQHGAEDRDAAVDLLEGHGGAVAVGSRRRSGELAAAWRRTRRRTRRGSRRPCRRRPARSWPSSEGLRSPVRATPDEADLAGRGARGRHATGPCRPRPSSAGPDSRRGRRGAWGRRTPGSAVTAARPAPTRTRQTCLAEDLHLLSLPEIA